MRTSSGACKTASTLSGSVHQHFNRFAIAAILAGVGWLALAWPAAAEIVYTPANITIGANSSYNLDVNNDGVTDVTISTSFQPKRAFCTIHGGGWLHATSVDETPATGNGVKGSPPAALIEGARIGPSHNYYAGQGTLSSYYDTWGPPPNCPNYNHYSGHWGHPIRYLGLALQINGEMYYGWAQLQVQVGYSEASATLTGYAYETIPGMPINAGQTADGSVALRPGSANREDFRFVASPARSTQPVALDALPLLAAQEV